MVCKSLDREGLILHGCLLMSRGGGGGGEVVWCLGKRSFVFERFLRSWGPCHCHLGPQKCGRWPRPNVTGFHSLTKLKDDELRTGPWMLSRSFIHSKTLLHTNSEWQTLRRPLKEGSAKKVEWTIIWYISRYIRRLHNFLGNGKCCIWKFSDATLLFALTDGRALHWVKMLFAVKDTCFSTWSFYNFLRVTSPSGC